jgi:hypothetical protein
MNGDGIIVDVANRDVQHASSLNNAEAEQARLEAAIATTKETARQEAAARVTKNTEQRARLAEDAAKRKAERDRRKEAELLQFRSRLKSATKP